VPKLGPRTGRLLGRIGRVAQLFAHLWGNNRLTRRTWCARVSLVTLMGRGITPELLFDSAHKPNASRAQPSAHGVPSMGETAEPPYRQTAHPERLFRNLPGHRNWPEILTSCHPECRIVVIWGERQPPHSRRTRRSYTQLSPTLIKPDSYFVGFRVLSGASKKLKEEMHGQPMARTLARG
jgi:hypothetical protein